MGVTSANSFEGPSPSMPEIQPTHWPPRIPPCPPQAPSRLQPDGVGVHPVPALPVGLCQHREHLRPAGPAVQLRHRHHGAWSEKERSILLVWAPVDLWHVRETVAGLGVHHSAANTPFTLHSSSQPLHSAGLCPGFLLLPCGRQCPRCDRRPAFLPEKCVSVPC